MDEERMIVHYWYAFIYLLQRSEVGSKVGSLDQVSPTGSNLLKQATLGYAVYRG